MNYVIWNILYTMPSINVSTQLNIDYIIQLGKCHLAIIGHNYLVARLLDEICEDMYNTII